MVTELFPSAFYFCSVESRSVVLVITLLRPRKEDQWIMVMQAPKINSIC